MYDKFAPISTISALNTWYLYGPVCSCKYLVYVTMGCMLLVFTPYTISQFDICYLCRSVCSYFNYSTIWLWSTLLVQIRLSISRLFHQIHVTSHRHKFWITMSIKIRIRQIKINSLFSIFDATEIWSPFFFLISTHFIDRCITLLVQ